MTKILSTAAGLAMVAALASQPAHAQARRAAAPTPAAAAPAAAGSNMIKGIAILNLDAALANSDAYRYAVQQRQNTYKAQIDQANQRQAAYEAQAKPLVDKLNADITAKRPEAELQTQATAIQALQGKAREEIQDILAPLQLSDEFVKEQIALQLDKAVQNAMLKRGVSLVISPEAVVARSNSYELTRDVIGELNILIPAAKVQIIPPAGWVPAAVRQQQQQAAQQGAAAPSAVPAAPAPRPATATPPKPAGPQPEGR